MIRRKSKLTLTPMQQRAIEYLNNAGPLVKASHFDDDHAPIGPVLRADLKALEAIIEYDGYICLSEEHRTPRKERPAPPARPADTGFVVGRRPIRVWR